MIPACGKKSGLATPPPQMTGQTIRGKTPIVKKDEPRMNTNSHEYGWTRSNDQRHRNASATLLPCNDFVDNRSISMVAPANRHLVNPFIGVHSCPLVVRRFPWHPVAVNLNALVALRRPSCVFVDNSFFVVSGKRSRNRSSYERNLSTYSRTASRVLGKASSRQGISSGVKSLTSRHSSPASSSPPMTSAA